MRVAILTTDNREHYQDYTLPGPIFGTAPEALLQGLARLPEVEVHVVSCLKKPVRSPEKLAANIWYHSLRIPEWGWMKSAFLGCIQATRKKLREIKPDIVHGQGTERDCCICAVTSGFPSVLTVHGNMRMLAQLNRSRPFSYGWLAARLESWTVPRAAGVVCITQYTRAAVADLAKKTWLLPNAVDERYFAAQRSLIDPPVVLCVGLICPRKNQIQLIKALDASEWRNRIQLVFLGHLIPGDPYSLEFEKLIADRSWCHHGGFADRDGLKRQLETAALVVLPSLEDNCPMVVLEAMAAGTPVLAARVGGLPDLIDPGVNGLFCDPQDPKSIRTGVETLLENREEAALMARQAHSMAQARFSPLTVARQHLDIYREVLRH